MAMGRIISGSHPASLLMGRVLFNCNRVWVYFLKFEIGSGIITLILPRLYFKNNLLLFFYTLI